MKKYIERKYINPVEICSPSLIIVFNISPDHVQNMANHILYDIFSDCHL